MKYILMDVEGTTTSISFVHEVLFPYAKKHLKAFIDAHAATPSIAEIIISTQKTVQLETQQEISREQTIDQLLNWIDEDRKHPALKKIQGMIWKNGYENFELTGHVYADVPTALASWKKRGLCLGVYSSGSIEAQKNLFHHSDFGDLSVFFSQHFDTAIGAKRELASYQKISQTLNIEAQEILFLSDTKEELDAARFAGFKTIQLMRTSSLEFQGHMQVANFLEISI